MIPLAYDSSKSIICKHLSQYSKLKFTPLVSIYFSLLHCGWYLKSGCNFVTLLNSKPNVITDLLLSLLICSNRKPMLLNMRHLCFVASGDASNLQNGMCSWDCDSNRLAITDGRVSFVTASLRDINLRVSCWFISSRLVSGTELCPWVILTVVRSSCSISLDTSSVLLNGMSLVFLVTFLVALFANLVLEVHYKSFWLTCR